MNLSNCNQICHFTYNLIKVQFKHFAPKITTTKKRNIRLFDLPYLLIFFSIVYEVYVKIFEQSILMMFVYRFYSTSWTLNKTSKW